MVARSKSRTNYPVTAEQVGAMMEAIHGQCVAMGDIGDDAPPSAVVASLACHALNQAGYHQIKRSCVDFEQTLGGTVRASISGVRIGEHFINHLWGIVGAKNDEILEAFLAYRVHSLAEADEHPWRIEAINTTALRSEEDWFDNGDVMALREQACAALSSIRMGAATHPAPSARRLPRRI